MDGDDVIDNQTDSQSDVWSEWLLHRWKAAQYPDTHEKIANSPIANYSERNLIVYLNAVKPVARIPTEPPGIPR
jgi:hypothetical protein